MYFLLSISTHLHQEQIPHHPFDLWTAVIWICFPISSECLYHLTNPRAFPRTHLAGCLCTPGDADTLHFETVPPLPASASSFPPSPAAKTLQLPHSHAFLTQGLPLSPTYLISCLRRERRRTWGQRVTLWKEGVPGGRNSIKTEVLQGALRGPRTADRWLPECRGRFLRKTVGNQPGAGRWQHPGKARMLRSLDLMLWVVKSHWGAGSDDVSATPHN